MGDHRRFRELAVGGLVDPHHLEFPLPDHHRAAHPGASGEELGLHRRREQHDGSTVLDIAGPEVLAILEPHLVDLRSLGRNTVNLREGVAGVGEQGRPLFHDRALTIATSVMSRIASASPGVSVSARPKPEGMFTASPPRM